MAEFKFKEPLPLTEEEIERISSFGGCIEKIEKRSFWQRLKDKLT